jgi:glycosyltransferase involved in cell wall biosynthesis
VTPARPRILAFAYDIEPDQGSEPGAGWSGVRMLAGFADVTVVTRRRPPGENGTWDDWTSRIPEAGAIHFVNVRLPGDPTWPGNTGRPARWSRQAHFGYMAWMVVAGRAARRLHAERPYDLAWHLTWANAWFGSTLATVPAPFVLGPIGGGVGPPWRLVLAAGPRATAFEIVRAIARDVARWLNPLARHSWSRARLILVQNRETLRWLPASARGKARVFNNATVVDSPSRTRLRADADPPVALFAGRLIGWKGGHIALKTLAALPGWRLIVCGDGPMRQALGRLAEELAIADRVEFRGWQTRDEVQRVMTKEADALLFPSFHDEAGLTVAEAVAVGLPVVCLDRGGPPVIAGGGVEPAGERETVARLARALTAAVESSPEPRPLDPATRRLELEGLLRSAGLLPQEQEEPAVGPA